MARSDGVRCAARGGQTVAAAAQRLDGFVRIFRIELAAQADAVSGAAVHPEIETLTAQVACLEARIFDQERAIRQTLTMLIEWIEGEMEQTKAA